MALLFAACHPPQAAVEGRRLLDRGEVSAAQKKVDQAVKAHPRDATLRRLSIEIRLAQNDRRGAVKSYRAWLDQRGKDERMLNFLALSVLRWGLSNRDPKVRLAALQGARKTDADTLEADVARRLDDPDELVKTWAAVALSRTPAGADTLSQQLRSTNAKARAVAVGNLARIAGKSAIKSLMRFVTDSSTEVRAALARGLGGVKDDLVLEPLGRLVRDKDRGVRAAAVASLGRAGRKGGMDMVETALNDEYLGVRLAAVLAFAELGGTGVKQRLRELAWSQDLPTAYRAGAKLVGMGEDQPLLNAVAKGLVDKKWSVRAAACNAASTIKQHTVALKLVRRALRDPEPRVRAAAARAVLAQGDKTAAARVGGLLVGLGCKSSDTELEAVCIQGAEVLLRAGDRSGLKHLEQLALKAKTAPHRREALRIALTGGALLELAVDVLPDPDADTAVAAAVQIYKKTED
jgi:HEAT repeat protein